MEEREFCHFDRNSRDFCAPPANLILEGIAIKASEFKSEQELCECGFRNGKEVCIQGNSTPQMCATKSVSFSLTI